MATELVSDTSTRRARFKMMAISNGGTLTISCHECRQLTSVPRSLLSSQCPNSVEIYFWLMRTSGRDRGYTGTIDFAKGIGDR